MHFSTTLTITFVPSAQAIVLADRKWLGITKGVPLTRI
jgi:hypothetical protein